MTVIAVRRQKTFIELSADSQTTHGWHKFEKGNDEKIGDSKIFQTNGMLIGGAGYVSESNLFKIFCNNHKPKDAEADSVTEFMYEFRDWVAKKTGNPGFKLYNAFIIVFEGEIFEAYEGNVSVKKDFWAVGSGGFLALAALHLGQSSEKAVEVAKVYDLYCGGKTVTKKVFTIKKQQ